IHGPEHPADHVARIAEIFMQRAQLLRNANRRWLVAKLSTVVLSILIVAMLATLVALVWQKSTQPVNTKDYEGRIIDRWADFAESEQGSRPRFHVLVESQDGKRFPVAVDANVYESAKVGVQIKSRAGQIVLIDSEKSPSGKY